MANDILTIDKLMVGLISEIQSSNITDYLELQKRKTKFFLSIIKGDIQESQFSSISDSITRQIEILSYYKDKIQRIERIINILNEYDHKTKQVNDTSSLLKEFKRALNPTFSKGIIELLNDQKDALSDKKIKKFIKYVKKESSLLKNMFMFSKSFNISESDDLFAKADFVNKKRYAIRTIMYMICLSFSLISANEISGFKDVIVMQDEYGKVVRTIEMMQKYSDTFHKSDVIVKNFENETGVQIIGEFTPAHILSILSILKSKYESDIMLKLGIHRIIITKDYVHANNLNPRNSHQGAITDGDMYIGLGKFDLFFQETFCHELSHAIYQYVASHNSGFNKDWLACDTNLNEDEVQEDAAELAEHFMTHELSNAEKENTIKFYEGSNKSSETVLKKVNVFKKYNFFNIKVLEN